MKLFLSIIFLMLTSIYNVNAQIKFQKTYGGTNDEVSYSHKQLPDGSYILVGNTISFGTGLTDGNAIKLDKDGVLEWSKTYGSVENESFIDVICTPDNGYLMGGFTLGFGNNNITSSFYLVKTDANGVEQWSKKYSDGEDFDRVDKLALTSDGGYICIGHNSYYATVFKLNINGDLVFSYKYQMAGSGITLGNSLKPTSDGGYIFTGFNRNGASLNDLILIKINDIGIVQWSKSYSAGSLGSMYGEDLVVLSDGSFVVSGYTDAFGAGGTDGLILKTNSDGILQWIHTYGGTDYDKFSGIDVACDGGFAISGSSRSFKNGIDDVFITKTNQNGIIQWAKVYGGTELDEGAYMKIASDCGLTVSGNTQSYGSGGRKLTLLK